MHMRPLSLRSRCPVELGPTVASDGRAPRCGSSHTRPTVLPPPNTTHVNLIDCDLKSEDGALLD